MSEQDPTSMESAALALYYHAARMIKEGKSRDEIIRELTRQGISEEAAKTMLIKLDQSRANVARRSGYRNIAAGTILLVMGGAPVFGIGIAQATDNAFVFVIFVLTIGLIFFGRGFMQIVGL